MFASLVSGQVGAWCTLSSFRPGSFIPLSPAQCNPHPPSLSCHYILLALQSVSESLFLSMTTMNSWTHYRQTLTSLLTDQWRVDERIHFIATGQNCEKQSVFDIYNTLKSINLCMNRTNILEKLEMLKDSQCFRTVSYSDNEIVIFFFKWNKHAVLKMLNRIYIRSSQLI